MKQNFSLIVALWLMTITSAVAQPNEGATPHRTRLIPYPTAQLAHEGSLAKNRYMQPIEEWIEVDDALRGEFTYPFSWVERQIYIRIEGCREPYEVWINGKYKGQSKNGFAPMELNITKVSKEDKNVVELRLKGGDETRPIESFDRGTPHPKAYIISQPRVRVRDVAWRTTIEQSGVVNADFNVIMQNETLGAKSSELFYEIYLNDTLRLTGGRLSVALGMYGVDTMRFGAPIPDTMLWSRERPTRLSLRLKNRIAGRDVEFYDFNLGMRQVEFNNGSYNINGVSEHIEWHDLSPRSTIADMEEILNRGIYAVRFTAGYVGDELLDFCDANGIYAAVTAPINSSAMGSSRKRNGNPSNNPAWCEEYTERTLQMIHTTKRHPSVIAYFLADDSANGICLYESYLAAKAITTTPIFYLDGGNEWNSDR